MKIHVYPCTCICQRAHYGPTKAYMSMKGSDYIQMGLGFLTSMIYLSQMGWGVVMSFRFLNMS